MSECRKYYNEVATKKHRSKGKVRVNERETQKRKTDERKNGTEKGGNRKTHKTFFTMKISMSRSVDRQRGKKIQLQVKYQKKN